MSVNKKIYELYDRSQYIANKMGCDNPSAEHVLLALLRRDNKGLGSNIIRTIADSNCITYAKLKPIAEKLTVYGGEKATYDVFTVILEKSKCTNKENHILLDLVCELLDHPNSNLRNILENIYLGDEFIDDIRNEFDANIFSSNELFIDKNKSFDTSDFSISSTDFRSPIIRINGEVVNCSDLYEEPEYKELTNFNKKMKNNKYEIVGMDDELNELIKGLMRVKKPNVIITGEAGIGKTALVEKLALSINKGNVPDFLKNKKIFELSINSTVAGTQYRGTFEEKLNKILDYIKDDGNIILFIDEIHMMVNAGSSEGSTGMGDVLKPALSRGEIQVIGATTQNEFNEYFKGDSALTRRFKVINMDEPNSDGVVDIVYGSKDIYEKHYNTTITKDEVISICEKAKNRKGNFPDKAFDELEDYLINKVWDKGGVL